MIVLNIVALSEVGDDKIYVHNFHLK